MFGFWISDMIYTNLLLIWSSKAYLNAQIHLHDQIIGSMWANFPGCLEKHWEPGCTWWRNRSDWPDLCFISREARRSSTTTKSAQADEVAPNLTWIKSVETLIWRQSPWKWFSVVWSHDIKHEIVSSFSSNWFLLSKFVLSEFCSSVRFQLFA